MADTYRSVLKHKGITYVINVLTFSEPRFEAPGRRGRKLPGEIKFVIPHADFTMDGIGYEISHDNKNFRFEATSSQSDLKMNAIVSGYIY